MTTYKAGYLFKPTHSEVHFVKRDHGASGDNYNSNFTRDAIEAKTFASIDAARDCIYHLMLDFELDDDYEWTPVITDESGRVVKDIRPFFKIGSEQFKSQYRDATTGA